MDEFEIFLNYGQLKILLLKGSGRGKLSDNFKELSQYSGAKFGVMTPKITCKKMLDFFFAKVYTTGNSREEKNKTGSQMKGLIKA